MPKLNVQGALQTSLPVGAIESSSHLSENKTTPLVIGPSHTVLSLQTIHKFWLIPPWLLLLGKSINVKSPLFSSEVWIVQHGTRVTPLLYMFVDLPTLITSLTINPLLYQSFAASITRARSLARLYFLITNIHNELSHNGSLLTPLYRETQPFGISLGGCYMCQVLFTWTNYRFPFLFC